MHGDEHRSMLSRGPRAARRDIEHATDTVADGAGVTPTGSGPRSGRCRPAPSPALSAPGSTTVL